MGNMGSMAGGPKEVVRVVRQDGKVLEFYDDVPIEELMVVYPNYVVSQDQVQENGQVKRKRLPPNEVLLKGQVYLLLLRSTAQKGLPQKQKAIRSAERPAKMKPVDVPEDGRVPLPPLPTKIGLAARQAFPKEHINKFLEAGSVKIITKDGTAARLSGPQLTRLLNEASSKGKFSSSRMMGSPRPSSISAGLQSVPEDSQHPKAF